MKLVFDRKVSQAAEQLVAQLAPGCERGFGNCVAFGVVSKDGNLVAGWVWHNWWPEAGTIEFSGASTTPKWMTRDILNELFSYAFDQLDCQMVTTKNHASNTRLHRQLKVYGFDRFDVPRLFGRDKDGVFWTLTREQWKESKFYGQTICSKAA